MIPKSIPLKTDQTNHPLSINQTRDVVVPPDLIEKYNDFFEDYDIKEPKGHKMQNIIDKLNHIIEIAEEGIYECEKQI